jgi:hypothetical protein
MDATVSPPGTLNHGCCYGDIYKAINTYRNTAAGCKKHKQDKKWITDRSKSKVKFSRCRPEQVLGDTVVKAPDFLDFRHYKGGRVVTPMHRPSLPS